MLNGFDFCGISKLFSRSWCTAFRCSQMRLERQMRVLKPSPFAGSGPTTKKSSSIPIRPTHTHIYIYISIYKLFLYTCKATISVMYCVNVDVNTFTYIYICGHQSASQGVGCSNRALMLWGATDFLWVTDRPALRLGKELQTRGYESGFTSITAYAALSTTNLQNKRINYKIRPKWYLWQDKKLCCFFPMVRF